MTEEPAIRQTQCPSCGAPIAWPEGETSMRCPYCNAGLERALPHHDEHKTEYTSPVQPQTAIQAVPIPTPSARAVKTVTTVAGASACSGLAVTLFIFVVVGAILAGVFLLNPDSPISVRPKTLQVHQPFILIPGGTGQPADVIAMSYDVKSETYAIGRLSLVTKKFLWRAAPVESISDVRSLAANDTTLFLVEKDTHLKALKLDDGSLSWESELVDKLGYGENSLAAQGERVVVLTQDYTLQAFDTITGKEAWNRRLGGYAAGFTLFSDSLAVIDTVDYRNSMFFLSLADGSVQKSFTPACERPDFPDWSNAVYASSIVHFQTGEDGTLDSGAVYFLYGSSPTCIDRWDITSGKLTWQNVDMDNQIPSNNETLVVATADKVYYGYDQQLWAVDQATAERKLLIEKQDYELLPLVMTEGTLIVRARRTRGSERFELWGVNPANGTVMWT